MILTIYGWNSFEWPSRDNEANSVEGVGRQIPPTQEVYAILNTPENGQFQYLSTDEFPIHMSASFSTFRAIEVMK